MADALTDRLSTLSSRLERYEKARDKLVLTGQASSIDGISISRANLASLDAIISRLVRDIQRLQYGGRVMSIDVSSAQSGGTAMLPTGS